MGTRSIALVMGILGVVLGGASGLASNTVLGVAAGAAALCAGILAVSGPTTDPEAEARVALLEGRLDEARRELHRCEETRTTALERLASLETELARATESVEPAGRHSPDLRASGTGPSDDDPGPDDSSAGASTTPVGRPAAPADRDALTDQQTQLFSEAYFRVALDARIASARRHLRPVAIALIDVYEESAAGSPNRAAPARAADSIRETVRDADTACRLDDGTFAVILEDTPENGAVWTVERVRRNLVSRFGTHTMWAGVACYPAHAFSADELLEQARVALEAAREWKQDRIEVAIAD